MRQRQWMLSLALVFLALPAAAGNSGVAASLDLGSTGVGLGVVGEFSPALNGRLGYRGYSFDADIESETSGSGASELDYSGDFKLRNVFGLLDFYPGDGRRLHLTGGAVYNDSDVQLDASCSNPNGCEVGGVVIVPGVGIGGVTINSVTADVDFREVAGYLGLGWGNPLADQTGWSFRVEAGAMFLGEPGVELTSTGTCQSDASCRAALEQEERELEEDAKDYEIYPIVNLTLSYRF
ncbi:MAG: hypothetical protein ACRETN_12045 [Nevskiales bacterium]